MHAALAVAAVVLIAIAAIVLFAWVALRGAPVCVCDDAECGGGCLGRH